MRLRNLLSSAALVIATAGGTVLAAPVSVHTLIVTENSSTSLSVTWDGLPIFQITPLAGDGWLFNLPDSVQSFRASWLEPDGTGLVNSILANGSNQLLVMSDRAVIVGAVYADGSVVGYVDGADRLAINVSFFDRESVGGSVPEPASLALAGLALAGIAATRRRKQ